MPANGRWDVTRRSKS